MPITRRSLKVLDMMVLGCRDNRALKAMTAAPGHVALPPECGCCMIATALRAARQKKQVRLG
jgi:hypothetical protein